MKVTTLLREETASKKIVLTVRNFNRFKGRLTQTESFQDNGQIPGWDS